MKAEKITMEITIRPTYAGSFTVKSEVEMSLEWLTEEHKAIFLSWGEVTKDGFWPDDDLEESNG